MDMHACICEVVGIPRIWRSVGLWYAINSTSTDALVFFEWVGDGWVDVWVGRVIPVAGGADCSMVAKGKRDHFDPIKSIAHESKQR